MENTIKVELTTPQQHRENGLPNMAAHLENAGITSSIILTSERCKKGSMVYEFGCKNGSKAYRHVTGSRALYNRWIRENKS